MSSFIATVLPNDTAPDPASAPIANDGWFPAIEPAAFREQLRIRDAVTPARAREALIAAILAVGRDLAVWSALHRLAGATALDEVPAPTLDGTSVLVLLYRRAVFTAAKAEVVERYRDTDLTSAGQRKAEDLEPSVSELRRD
ncbi:MAG TPA: head completion/stabilization protein, partial [Sphingomonas sp.]